MPRCISWNSRRFISGASGPSRVVTVASTVSARHAGSNTSSVERGSLRSCAVRTLLPVASMSALVLFIGAQIGGGQYLPLALIFAVLMNGIAYFFSAKIAIMAARAKPVTEAQFPELYRIVSGLAGRAGIPMPKLYVSPSDQPNAFATGRNPKHAAVEGVRL